MATYHGNNAPKKAARGGLAEGVSAAPPRCRRRTRTCLPCFVRSGSGDLPFVISQSVVSPPGKAACWPQSVLSPHQACLWCSCSKSAARCFFLVQLHRPRITNRRHSRTRTWQIDSWSEFNHAGRARPGRRCQPLILSPRLLGLCRGRVFMQLLVMRI